jgi:threonine aldolase
MLEQRPPYLGFSSDNIAAAAPEVVQAIIAANAGQTASYGADELSQGLEGKFSRLFERDVVVCLVPTGTVANVLSLSVLTPPWGSVLCHPNAHINVDECGAPEFYTAGAKLVLVDGPDGKIDPDALAIAARRGVGDVHSVQPSCISITQATETGSVYVPAEVARIGGIAREAGLRLHMDGSRFANAVAALGCTPAQLTWRAGVDVLSFGATKNGAMAAEAIILFDTSLRQELEFRRKRGGHLWSKMRFLAAQLEALLDNDLWLRNAHQANAMSRRLAEGLRSLPGVRIQGTPMSNILFCALSDALIIGLRAEGFRFYSDRWGPNVVRLVTSFATTTADVDNLLRAARTIAS